MSILSTLGVSISNAFNAIYVEAVNTFSTQSHYNVYSSMKSSNYMKIQLKALKYFQLQQTSK